MEVASVGKFMTGALSLCAALFARVREIWIMN
jgi:hypothetical protein